MTLATSAEQSLAKYHLLHFVIGAIIAAVMLAIPKLAVIALAVFCIAMLLPSVILADFHQSKWLDRAATVVGAIVVGVVFHQLHKL